MNLRCDRVSQRTRLMSQLRSALRLTEPDRTLYLAVPEYAYNEFFRRRFIQIAIGEHQLKLLIFNPANEEIVQWRN